MTKILSKLLLSNILYIPVIYVALRKISAYSYLMCEEHGKLKMFFHARNYALNIPPPNVAFKKGDEFFMLPFFHNLFGYHVCVSNWNSIFVVWNRI